MATVRLGHIWVRSALARGEVTETAPACVDNNTWIWMPTEYLPTDRPTE